MLIEFKIDIAIDDVEVIELDLPDMEDELITSFIQDLTALVELTYAGKNIRYYVDHILIKPEQQLAS